MNPLEEPLSPISIGSHTTESGDSAHDFDSAYYSSSTDPSVKNLSPPTNAIETLISDVQNLDFSEQSSSPPMTALEPSISLSAESVASNTSTLSINSISTVIVHGLLKENGVDVPLSFNRFDPPPVAPFLYTDHNVHPGSQNGLPVPMPTLSLPPPGDLNIEITLADGVECADFGLELSVEGSILSSGPGTSAPSVPPLSMRMAATRAVMLEKEAWFYDHLQILQGSVIPRCYGLFEATLDWSKIEFLVHPDTNTVLKAEYAQWWENRNENIMKPNRIVILLLERLSTVHLPNDEPMSDADRVELSELFEEISKFSVDHRNVGYESVSRALDSPPGLPSLCSPHLGKIYKWRVSNFYDSRKSNSNPRIIQQCNEIDVASLVWNLMNGNYLS